MFHSCGGSETEDEGAIHGCLIMHQILVAVRALCGSLLLGERRKDQTLLKRPNPQTQVSALKK